MQVVALHEIVGKIPVQIRGEVQDDTLVIHFTDGTSIKFYHSQDCCECVFIEDIVGDWTDLLNTPLVLVEERTFTSEEDTTPAGCTCWDVDSWTFYSFQSAKGVVDVRWHGSSNGYYSTSVDWRVEKELAPDAQTR